LLSAAFHQHTNYRYVIGYAIEPILTAVLIVQIVYFADRWPGRLFTIRPVAYLGAISYSLYLYQGLTVFTAKSLTSAYPVVVQLAAVLGVTVVFAALSHAFVEQRFRSWLSRKWNPSNDSDSTGSPSPITVPHPYATV
jgi:peptidoglycan/LPS O-acetylase OafA/YrhL